MNIHVFVYNDALWRGHLAVREYLRAQPRMARLYQHIKQTFAAHYPHDLRAYGQAKRPFLNSIERLALHSQGMATSHLITPKIAPAPLPPHDPIPHPKPAPPHPSPSVSLSSPDGWQVSVWYELQPNGTWQVSTDQNPKNDGAVGVFVEYLGLDSDGNYHWYIYGNGNSSNTPPNDPIADDTPPPGLVTPDASSVIYVITGEANGKEITILLLSANFTNYPIPENAIVIANTDGTYLVKYNNDGSTWTEDNNEGSGSDGQGDSGQGDSGQGDSGETGGDGDDEVDDGSPYDNR